MQLPGFIARRYLFAKKSHNVINIISIIAAAGIAIGTAALVIILSIYNGFDRIVRDLNDSYTADVLIERDSIYLLTVACICATTTLLTRRGVYYQINPHRLMFPVFAIACIAWECRHPQCHPEESCSYRRIQ